MWESIFAILKTYRKKLNDYGQRREHCMEDRGQSKKIYFFRANTQSLRCWDFFTLGAEKHLSSEKVKTLQRST
jgi:hypothetical protein